MRTECDNGPMPEMTVEQALRAAVSHHQAGRLQDAERLYRAIIQAQPKHPDANHNLGALAVQVGKPEVGLAHLKTALEANPSVAQFWVSYGDTLLKSGRAAEAISILDQAAQRGIAGPKLDALRTKIAESSEDPLAPAIAHVKAGRSAEAAAWLADYLQRSPRDARALSQLGELVRHQPTRLDEALSLLVRALELDPKISIAWLSYGSALHQANRNAEAKAAFSNVLKLTPNRVEALNDLGTIFLDEENWQEAAALFEKAVSLAPNAPDMHLNYAKALAKLDRIEEAEAAARRVQALGHGDRLGITMFLAKLGRVPVPDRAPDAFLKTIYASRASYWDKGSVNGEQRYRGAELVATALEKLAEGELDILDAGCGTGLVGDLLAHRAGHLDGVDLSEEMLEKAKAKNIYRSLHQGEIVEYLEKRPSAYDAITCAATFIHFGDLSGAFNAASNSLRQNGLLVFTVFPNDQIKDGFAIGPIIGSAQGGLYEHGEGYIVRTARAAGFVVELLERHIHEYFRGAPKMGLVVVLRRV